MNPPYMKAIFLCFHIKCGICPKQLFNLNAMFVELVRRTVDFSNTPCQSGSQYEQYSNRVYIEVLWGLPFAHLFIKSRRKWNNGPGI